MHKENIELVQQETLRLLNQFTDVVHDIPMVDSKGSSKGSFTREDKSELLSILNTEQRKLDAMESVIVVVGTMKAGKSTTINSIVGREILPNRNSAMTSVPTLIRHIPGKTEAVLKFSNSTPLEKHIITLKDSLTDIPYDTLMLYKEPDGKELIDLIVTGELQIENEYKEETGIFFFLRILNDIVRLSRELNVDFPFSEFSEMGKYPVIEVEFTALKHITNNSGVFSFLDTPGPNEAKLSEELSKTIREQIKKATGVLLVTNFTQMNTEADEQTHDVVYEALELADNRVYLFVNKYDNKSGNDKQSEDQLKESLMERYDNHITKDRIYPTSAVYALLANRGQTILDKNDLLSNYIDESWMKDYVKYALNYDADEFEEAKDEIIESINDRDDVIRQIKKLTRRSKMATPLKEIIENSYVHAALHAINAPLDKMLAYTRNGSSASVGNTIVEGSFSINNYLNVIKATYKKNIDELKSTIGQLQRDIETTEQLEKESRAYTQKYNTSVSERFGKHLEEITKGVENLISKFFAEGKRIEVEEKKESSNDAFGAGFFKSILGGTLKNNNNEEPLFDPNSPKIGFSSKGRRDKLIDDINEELKKLFAKGFKVLDNALKKEMEQLKNNLHENSVRKLNELKESIQSGFEKENISLAFNIPELTIEEKKWKTNDFDEQKGSTTKTFRQSGVFGGPKRLLGSIFGQSDWGYYDETYYTVDMNHMKKSVLTKFNKEFKDVSKKEIKDQCDEVSSEINDVFSQFKKSLEGIRSDFQKGIESKKKDSQENEKLCIRFEKSIKDISHINDCALHLKENELS